MNNDVSDDSNNDSFEINEVLNVKTKRWPTTIRLRHRRVIRRGGVVKHLFRLVKINRNVYRPTLTGRHRRRLCQCTKYYYSTDAEYDCFCNSITEVELVRIF